MHLDASDWFATLCLTQAITLWRSPVIIVPAAAVNCNLVSVTLQKLELIVVCISLLCRTGIRWGSEITRLLCRQSVLLHLHWAVLKLSSFLDDRGMWVFTTLHGGVAIACVGHFVPWRELVILLAILLNKYASKFGLASCMLSLEIAVLDLMQHRRRANIRAESWPEFALFHFLDYTARRWEWRITPIVFRR